MCKPRVYVRNVHGEREANSQGDSLRARANVGRRSHWPLPKSFKTYVCTCARIRKLPINSLILRFLRECECIFFSAKVVVLLLCNKCLKWFVVWAGLLFESVNLLVIVYFRGKEKFLALNNLQNFLINIKLHVRMLKKKHSITKKKTVSQWNCKIRRTSYACKVSMKIPIPISLAPLPPIKSSTRISLTRALTLEFSHLPVGSRREREQKIK